MRGLLDGVRSAGERARLLLVHAHPDDETLTTGVAIAHHVARGEDVHVLTCTLGEEGEVIPPDWAHLEGDGPALAAHRRGELRCAMERSGVTHHLLGARSQVQAPAFRDSGMAGSAAARHPRAFAAVGLDDAAEAIRAVLEQVRPDVVVTYDASGGYGHPDHVRAHQATCRAVDGLHGAGRPVLYGTLTPQSWAREDRMWLAEHAPEGQDWVVPDAASAYASDVVPDHVVTHAVIDRSVLPAQLEALRAHETQVVVGQGWYALSNRHLFRLAGREGYARLDPSTGRPLPVDDA